MPSVLLKYQRWTTPFLLLTAGIFIFYPYLNFQFIFSQADHGHQLYVFKKTFDGALPYRDYVWAYGPLMPYYYSIFFRMFGIDIQSILLGKMAFSLLVGFLFYLNLSTLFTPLIALIGTIWFWTFCPDFFYTYNHIAGIAFSFATTYFLFRYYETLDKKYFFLSLTSVFLVNLVKLNIGLGTLLAFCASLVIINFMKRAPRAKLRFRTSFLSIACTFFLVLGVYLFFNSGIPLEYIRQNFPFLGADRPFHLSLGGSMQIIWQNHLLKFLETPFNAIFAVLVACSAIQTFLFLAQKPLKSGRKRQIQATIFILVFFFVINLHEFLLSGIHFTLLWAMPFLFLLTVIFLAVGTQKFPAFFRLILFGAILLMAFLRIAEQHRLIAYYKSPGQYLPWDRAKIYTANPPAWMATVGTTTEYLRNHLGPDETFLAIPFEPLYFFLTKKDSPVYQLAFYKFNNITMKMENDIIRQLEQKKVNWIVLSSFFRSGLPALGFFGKTHCQLLFHYIEKHFTIVTGFGDWQSKPVWGGSHGVIILKRIQQN